MRIWIVVVLGIAAAALWWETRTGDPSGRGAALAGTRERNSPFETSVGDEGAKPVRTKSADRPDSVANQTHGPERLREFMLPAMAIKDLSLEGALEELRAAYEDACHRSGETPLPLTFSIAPSGTPRKLTIHLPAGNFSSSIRLLATFSGMKASRDGRAFLFEPFAGEQKHVKREFRVSPSLQSDLNEMAAGLTHRDSVEASANLTAVSPMAVDQCLKELGLDLDPSTKMVLSNNGKLTLETNNAADAAAISTLAKILAEQRPLQVKISPKILEFPAGSDWIPPDVSRMTDAEAQLFMRKVAQTNGTHLKTLPTVSSRNGQNARLEIVREFIYPTDDSSETFETRLVGDVLEVDGNFLGFGHELGMDFTDTTVDVDPVTGKPTFDVRTAMAGTGFTSDGGSRFVVQTRPDGSKTVMLLNAVMIDATGRPVRGPDGRLSQ